MERGGAGFGVLVGDSLMFQRGGSVASDPHLGQVYGLALPLVKRGIPLAPVQLENLTVPDYLKGFSVLLLTYDGMNPKVPKSMHRWRTGYGAAGCWSSSMTTPTPITKSANGGTATA